ncbi:MAG: phage integrase central domain-containing protein, partial [Actinomycetales bacterium]
MSTSIDTSTGTSTGTYAGASTGTGAGVLGGPGPGDRVWETTHGVRMRMPTAAYPYYRLDYRLGGVRRTPSGGTDWQAAWAEAHRIDALVAADLGLGSELTVHHLAEQWFAVENARWSDRHREETRRYLDRVVIPGIGALPLPDLRRVHLRELLDSIASDSVRQKVRVVVSGMLAWGHGEGLLVPRESDLMPPARRGGRAPHQPTWVDPAEIPDEADVITLHQALTMPRPYESKHAGPYQPPPWLAMMPMLAASTGARQGECFALRVSDVDGDMLLIDEQVQVIGGQPKFVPPKMGKIRKVVMSADAFGLDTSAA